MEKYKMFANEGINHGESGTKMRIRKVVSH